MLTLGGLTTLPFAFRFFLLENKRVCDFFFDFFSETELFVMTGLLLNETQETLAPVFATRAKHMSNIKSKILCLARMFKDKKRNVPDKFARLILTKNSLQIYEFNHFFPK
jgi:hypothetical protein